jgi:hypothetical protein
VSPSPSPSQLWHQGIISHLCLSSRERKEGGPNSPHVIVLQAEQKGVVYNEQIMLD